MKQNADGSIDIVINHPTLGPLPFTASAADVEEHGRALHATAAQCWPWFEQLQANYPDEAARVAALPIEEIAALAGVEIGQ